LPLLQAIVPRMRSPAKRLGAATWRLLVELNLLWYNPVRALVQFPV
jgi:hypothetical protein